jgi:hypothetical protein
LTPGGVEYFWTAVDAVYGSNPTATDDCYFANPATDSDCPAMTLVVDTRMELPTLQFKLTAPSSGTTIDWGFGNPVSAVANPGENTMPNLPYGTPAGIYVVTIRGTFTDFELVNPNKSLLSITRWHNTQSVHATFSGAVNLEHIVKPPSSLTDMSDMFRGTEKFNQPLQWDTSKVKRMDSMFYGALEFNQHLGFDVRNVETMRQMFFGSINFNKQVEFNSPKLLDTSMMFYSAAAFNSPIHLDTGNVTNMSNMFNGANAFADPSINDWDTHSVTQAGLANMFTTGRDFSATQIDLSSWNVEHIVQVPTGWVTDGATPGYGFGTGKAPGWGTDNHGWIQDAGGVWIRKRQPS